MADSTDQTAGAGMDEKEVETRLVSTRAAQERTRIAFIANTLISLAMFAITYNGYISIYKQFILNHYLDTTLTAESHPYAEYGVELLPPAADPEVMPRRGKNLIVLGVVNQTFYLRVFDETGEIVADTDEIRLREVEHPIKVFKAEIERLRPPHVLNKDEKFRLIATVTPLVEAEKRRRTIFMQERLASEWVSSRFVTLSLIGLKFGVGDAPELGAIAVLVSSIWFYLVVRRENYTIAVLLRDAWNYGDKDTRWTVFHGINSYTVFTNAYQGDEPIDDLRLPEGDPKRNAPKRLSIGSLYFLPVIALFISLVCDILTTYGFLASPFRSPNDRRLYPETWVPFAYWFVSLIFMSINLYICIRIYKFSSATEQVLRHYYNNLSSRDYRTRFVTDIYYLSQDKALPKTRELDAHYNDSRRAASSG